MKIDNTNLKEMQTYIENIEENVLALKTVGAGIPVIENNVRILLSAVRNLRFGIVDPAALVDE